MRSTKKVNELINIIEKKCIEYCQSENKKVNINLRLDENTNFVYHIDTGLMMFYGKVWYLDEERVNNVSNIIFPSMRNKLAELVNRFYVNIKDIERMAFELS